jgi:hypothetical protein
LSTRAGRKIRRGRVGRSLGWRDASNPPPGRGVPGGRQALSGVVMPKFLWVGEG